MCAPLSRIKEGDMRQKSATTSRKLRTAFGLALLGSVMLAGSPAFAEILQFSALGLIKRCPCILGTEADDAEQNNGVLELKGVDMTYFMPVALPDGQRVCRFTMIYNDTNASDSMVAVLKRKRIDVGGDPEGGVTNMALVTSAAGTPDTMRKVSDASIVKPLINTNKNFYFIELDAPSVNLNPIGFQIDVRDGPCA
jgi:hypothetical protein